MEETNIGKQILYEDNHLIVINKRCGQIVQADITEDLTLPEYIRAYIKERDHKPGECYCGVVHRIDRPVSGVVLFAKTTKALGRMNDQWKVRGTRKTYWAITEGMPPEPEGHLFNWLLRNKRQNKSYVVPEGTRGAKDAELIYRVVGMTRGGYCMIEVDLLTGRHHQIRTMLSHLGCPIKGDIKYGAEGTNEEGGIYLHARRLAFTHPVRKVPMLVIAPPPENYPIWQDFVKATADSERELQAQAAASQAAATKATAAALAEVAAIEAARAAKLAKLAEEQAAEAAHEKTDVD